MSATELLGGLNEMLHDQWAGNRGHQRVLLHVLAVGLDRRQAVVIREFILRVDDDGLDRTTVEGALAHGLHILATLAQVQRYCDDFAAGHFCQVRDRYRGVEAARVGKHYAISHVLLL